MKKLIITGLLMVLLVPAAAMADVGYDGGFYVQNDEKTFKLKFTGRVQTSFFYEKEKNGPAATMQFRLRRALLGVGADVHEIVHIGFSIMHTSTDLSIPNQQQTFQNVNIAGAMASIKVIPAFVVTAGMVGLPLAMINEMSSAWYLMSEAPIVISRNDTLSNLTPLRSSFGAPDGIGINFAGSYWKWFYSLSVVNNTETNYSFTDNTKAMSFGFRTGFNIMDPVPGSLTDFECSQTPKLTVSLGSMYQGGRTDNSGAVIKYLWTSSLGVGFRWAGFSITTEGFYRRTRITNLGGTVLWARPKLTDIGYYAAVGYYVIPKKLEIAAQAGQSIRQGPANNSWEFGGGLNYYIFENNLKVQLGYTMSRYFALDATNTYTLERTKHNVTLMASALF